MAEFQKVVRQIKRMCDSHGASCHSCPLKRKSGPCTLVHDDEFIPGDWEDIKAAEIEMVVMHWAANNPEPVYPTWREWQEANFPNTDSIIRPCVFESENYFNCVNKTGCELCENERIPADIAEKLGIKPIGGTENAWV